MSSMNDRRHTVQRGHTTAEVDHAISMTIFGKENQQIMRDLFLSGMTYNEAAYAAHLSLRGIQKRVKTIYPPLKEYLEKLN